MDQDMLLAPFFAADVGGQTACGAFATFGRIQEAFMADPGTLSSRRGVSGVAGNCSIELVAHFMLTERLQLLIM